MPLKLSIVIPAHNEEDGIGATILKVHHTMENASIEHEILVVNDHSSDRTGTVLDELAGDLQQLRWITNEDPPGFGYAVRAGLNSFTGDAVCIVMGDSSDDPDDIVTYFRKLEEGYDCVFGTRFCREACVVDYPRHKLVINRFANTFIQIVFGLRYNDVTNAFKCYRRRVIEGISPLLSRQFNLTVELPLKSIVRGFTYTVVPTNWYNRTTGVSKLKIKEMGSRYLFIVLYVWLERSLSRGDYLHRVQEQTDGSTTSTLPG